MSEFPFNDYEQLAQQIIAGETVFFIGAGFSLDSEGNSGWRLLARLLIRFESLTRALFTLSDDDKERQEFVELVITMKEVFGLEWADAEYANSCKWRQIYSEDNVSKLADDYYPANDWFCEVFSDLLDYIYRQFKLSIDDIHDKLELFEAEFFEQGMPEKVVPMDTLELRLYENLDERDRGKALFLDTMGFNNKDIMAGRPYHNLYEQAVTSYGKRILPRHLILARWAREGFMPTILTSNYDLLLEGAYRQVGFNPAEPEVSATCDLDKASFDEFAVIAGSTEFFISGHGHQRALIVKIHGCVDRYRVYRDNNDKWQQYLKSIVFTYREIQNWRQDSWSRDLVATLLRTRKMVFASYSVMDPVLHDTIRSIYEEIGAQAKQAPVRCADRPELDVPAYYLGVAHEREFYGIEILRAAARVNGERFPSLSNPSNYLRFNLNKDTGFPSLDDTFTWLFHRTYRLRQANLLETSLSRTLTMVFGKSRPKADIEKLKCHFKKLCDQEKKQAASWEIGNDARDNVISDFNQMTHWTSSFHPKLLREFVLAEYLQNNGGLGSKHHAIRESLHYFPILDYPNASVWAVVIEVALKRAMAAWRNVDEKSIYAPTPWLTVGEGIYPQLHYARGGDTPAKNCLTIKLANNSRSAESFSKPGHFKNEVIWPLDTNSQPWTTEDSSKKDDTTKDSIINQCKVPSADVLWRWAIEDSLKAEEIEYYLERHNEQ